MDKKLFVSLKSKKTGSQTSQSSSFLTLNTLLTYFRGEKWKDIPGFEDEYQLSNYGRVKSQDRWVDMGRCDCFRPGKILKLRLTSSAKKNEKVTVDLQMKLSKDKKRYQFSVARYVYYLFVAAFDLEDHTIIVTRKDGNKLNCYYKNLLLRSISEVAKEGFATQKRTSPFQLQTKPVTQYSLEGKKIKLYGNTKEAAETTGIAPGYINGAAKTKRRTAGGYFWRYGKANPFIDVSIYKKPVEQALGAENIRQTTEEFSHHYLNRDTKNISGEKWKDTEGYPGIYQVSDHGRVRSLSRPREVITLTGKVACYWTREMIMKQNLMQSFNHYIGEPLYYLTVSLKKDGVYTTFIVSRLVYQLFGRDKDTLNTNRVIHKDGDNLNNRISNLELASQSEIEENSYKNKRRQSHFAMVTSKKRVPIL